MRTKAILFTIATLVSTSIATAVPMTQRPFQMISPSPSPSLTDLLTRSKHSRLFYDYIRESTSVSTRLANPLESTVLLAPLDSAIISLERRPHQGPPEPAGGYVEGYSGSREDEQARADYLEKWIKRHLVDGKGVIDFEDPTKQYDTLQAGHKVSFGTSEIEGRKSQTVLPGDVEVVEIEEASNGMIMYLRGTLNLDNVD